MNTRHKAPVASVAHFSRTFALPCGPDRDGNVFDPKCSPALSANYPHPFCSRARTSVSQRSSLWGISGGGHKGAALASSGSVGPESHHLLSDDPEDSKQACPGKEIGGVGEGLLTTDGSTRSKASASACRKNALRTKRTRIQKGESHHCVHTAVSQC